MFSGGRERLHWGRMCKRGVHPGKFIFFLLSFASLPLSRLKEKSSEAATGGVL